MKSLESRIVDFFNRWIFKDEQNSLDTVINTINLGKEDAVLIPDRSDMRNDSAEILSVPIPIRQKMS